MNIWKTWKYDQGYFLPFRVIEVLGDEKAKIITQLIWACESKISRTREMDGEIWLRGTHREWIRYVCKGMAERSFKRHMQELIKWNLVTVRYMDKGTMDWTGWYRVNLPALKEVLDTGVTPSEPEIENQENEQILTGKEATSEKNIPQNQELILEGGCHFGPFDGANLAPSIKNKDKEKEEKKTKEKKAKFCEFCKDGNETEMKTQPEKEKETPPKPPHASSAINCTETEMIKKNGNPMLGSKVTTLQSVLENLQEQQQAPVTEQQHLFEIWNHARMKMVERQPLREPLTIQTKAMLKKFGQYVEEILPGIKANKILLYVLENWHYASQHVGGMVAKKIPSVPNVRQLYLHRAEFVDFYVNEHTQHEATPMKAMRKKTTPSNVKVDEPDQNCFTLPTGECVSTKPCMHTPGYFEQSVEQIAQGLLEDVGLLDDDDKWYQSEKEQLRQSLDGTVQAELQYQARLRLLDQLYSARKNKGLVEQEEDIGELLREITDYEEGV